MLMLSVLVIGFVLYNMPAWANPACAVCTVGVAVGLEVARNLGVDDGVIAVWAGALLALIGYWTILWFDKKGWKFFGRNFLLMALSLSMVAGVYIKDLQYTPKPILIYSSVFYQWMKARNGGHAHFPFEKVVLPILALTIAGYAVNYLQLCQPAEAAVSIPADGSDIYDFNH